MEDFRSFKTEAKECYCSYRSGGMAARGGGSDRRWRRWQRQRRRQPRHSYTIIRSACRLVTTFDPMRGGDDANPQASRDNDLISKMKVYHEAISGRVGGELGWMVQNIIIAFVPFLAQAFVPSFRKWAYARLCRARVVVAGCRTHSRKTGSAWDRLREAATSLTRVFNTTRSLSIVRARK